MFYMNHDDIEGLFRDAAENYQVRTDKAFDWDRINNAIHKNPDNDDGSSNRKRNKRRFIVWFFLFITIGLFSYSVWLVENQKNAALKITADKNTPSNKTKEQDKSTITIEENETTKVKSPRQPVKNQTILPEEKNIFATRSDKIKITGNSLSSSLHGLQQNRENLNLTDNTVSDKKINTDNNAGKSPEQPLIFKNNKDEKANNNDAAKTDSNITAHEIAAVANKKKAGKKGSGFYAGILVAPDATFIRFQKTKGIGISYGVTAGYQLNNKWSIETGVLLETKKYYTKGEYFDKSKVHDLDWVNLLTVNGNCHMIEIPLNIRYKFSGDNKHNWTAAIGSSSYFMTKEYYDYSIMRNGQNENREQTYHSASNKLFAVMNLSAGYEQKLNNGFSLRVEPYFKVPFRGIGTGSLHMSSTGINFGINKYFGKK